MHHPFVSSCEKTHALNRIQKYEAHAEGGRVESNGRLAPAPLLPLIEPDVRFSRIRLSCKHFFIDSEVPVSGDIGSGSSLSGGGIFFGCDG